MKNLPSIPGIFTPTTIKNGFLLGGKTEENVQIDQQPTEIWLKNMAYFWLEPSGGARNKFF